jgi:hypothetical protein
MQKDLLKDKKRKIDAVDSHVNTEILEQIESPLQSHVFVQIMDDYNYNFLVAIDPLEDVIIHEDLLEFEKSKISIQMNNCDPESLYELYEDKIARPERRVAWMKFFHDISLRKNPDKSEIVMLNREDCYKIQKARWFVTFSSR